MKTRILLPNESHRAGLVRAVCFEGNLDYEAEREKELAMTPEEIEAAQRFPETDGPALPSDHLPPHRDWGAFSDDGETLIGCVNVNTYPIRFDGKETLMGGIGGVATLPPYRRGGAIRACMQAAFRQMYDDGFAFSTLYPFSRAYYRQFGFEDGGPVHEWEISLSALKNTFPGGTIRQLFSWDDLSPLTAIYNRFYKGCNLSVIRREFDPSLAKENLLNQQRYIYLWEDAQGNPRGFFISKKQDRVLDCSTGFRLKNAFLALDAEAYGALFAFARTAFAADYDAIRLILPGHISPASLISEGNQVSCKRSSNGMVRAVSVPLVLESCRCRGEGQVKIEISDPLLPENCGVWLLEFAEGRPNRVCRTAEQPDITLPVSAFSALICGIRSAEELPMMPEAAVRNPAALLDRVFYRKPCHFLDLF